MYYCAGLVGLRTIATMSIDPYIAVEYHFSCRKHFSQKTVVFINLLCLVPSVFHLLSRKAGQNMMERHRYHAVFNRGRQF